MYVEQFSETEKLKPEWSWKNR